MKNMYHCCTLFYTYSAFSGELHYFSHFICGLLGYRLPYYIRLKFLNCISVLIPQFLYEPRLHQLSVITEGADGSYKLNRSNSNALSESDGSQSYRSCRIT